ncbi:MAG TPA: MFS transporter [Povalibacter sp.]
MHDRKLSVQDGRTLVLAAGWRAGVLRLHHLRVFRGNPRRFVLSAGHSGLAASTANLRNIRCGYLARPLGGVLMAHFGDLGGRKRMFMFSVLLMAIPTLLMGMLPTFASIGVFAPVLLLILRILQGGAVGGEVPGAWVFVSEHVPANRVGLACGVLTAGLTVGILLGSATASVVNLLWTTQEVLSGYWRAPFIVGGAFGLLALWLRRFLSETPVFQAMRERRQLVEGLPSGRCWQGAAGMWFAAWSSVGC